MRPWASLPWSGREPSPSAGRLGARRCVGQGAAGRSGARATSPLCAERARRGACGDAAGRHPRAAPGLPGSGPGPAPHVSGGCCPLLINLLRNYVA